MATPACALGSTSSFGSEAPWFEITGGCATGRRRCRKIEGYVSQLTYFILNQW